MWWLSVEHVHMCAHNLGVVVCKLHLDMLRSMLAHMHAFVWLEL